MKDHNALAVSNPEPFRQVIHPVHAALLAAMLPLFLGALLSDWVYSSSYQIQWINFASWLIVGALLFAGIALLLAAIDALRVDAPRGRANWLHFALLSATFVFGVINALIHGKDGWATMPEGLVLSVIVFILALAAVWTGFSVARTGASK